MQITEQQRRQLAEDLPRDVVKTREQAGQRLSYVDGWYAVSRANEVFGPDGWSYATREIREVYRGTRPGRDGENTVIVYEAVVAVTALGITREDVGIGQCDASLKALAQGIEKARKEAVTDGLKRALRTFGPSFGLALYDKDQKDVGLSRAAMALRDALAASDDPDAFARDHADELRSLEADERDELRALLVARRHEVTAQAALRAAAQPATITRETLDAMDASTQAVQAAEVRALAPPPATVPKQSALDDVRESAAARHTVRELADLWRLARADLKAAKATEAGWKIIADRALALGLVPAAVKAEVRRLDDDRGPGGGQRAEAAPQHADAQGSAAEATPAQGSVARADAWRATRKGIAAHVGTIASARHLESSGRQHLRAINGDLELHALHAYADRLRALSRRTERDEEGNRIVTELPREQCFATAETWRREGPRVAVLAPRPAPSTKIAAGGAR